MNADKTTTAKIPVIVAEVCLAIILIIVVFALAGGSGGVVSGSSSASCACPAVTTAAGTTDSLVLPATCPAVSHPGDAGPSVPEPLSSADLVLTRPPPADLVPYTSRGFRQPTEAAIAWWMSPGFMDNTSEFRMYQRKTAEGRAAFPEEHRIFFEFIEAGLDDAEQQSVLRNDIILFRGISPGVAATVLDHAVYREPAFASTSYDITLSLDSFGPRSPDGYRNMIVLERLAGDHALYINEDEREFLLPRGTTWHVVKAVNVENLTVQADFPLHGRNATTASFDHVRLIYVTEATCL
jgi:hypothetical protein